MIMIQIYSSELFLREKDKNCVNSDQYTEYFEDIWGSKVGSIEIPESYITCLIWCIIPTSKLKKKCLKSGLWKKNSPVLQSLVVN